MENNHSINQNPKAFYPKHHYNHSISNIMKNKNLTFTTVSSNVIPFIKKENKSYSSKADISSLNSSIENVAIWFLSKTSMTNKKLQKVCYYAYCWYIVFFNDLEAVISADDNNIQVLCTEKFQAWIHGPVCPLLYHRYKCYGRENIPQTNKPIIDSKLNDLFEQVWEAYGNFSADELEAISHQEMPWINARQNQNPGSACPYEIRPYDILVYYSSLR